MYTETSPNGTKMYSSKPFHKERRRDNNEFLFLCMSYSLHARRVYKSFKKKALKS